MEIKRRRKEKAHMRKGRIQAKVMCIDRLCLHHRYHHQYVSEGLLVIEGGGQIPMVVRVLQNNE